MGPYSDELEDIRYQVQSSREIIENYLEQVKRLESELAAARAEVESQSHEIESLKHKYNSDMSRAANDHAREITAMKEAENEQRIRADKNWDGWLHAENVLIPLRVEQARLDLANEYAQQIAAQEATIAGLNKILDCDIVGGEMDTKRKWGHDHLIIAVPTVHGVRMSCKLRDALPIIFKEPTDGSE